MSKQRPNPEKLLRRAEDEARKESRGKLKIYLGAAPGVGKTYGMLHDALSERSKGLDVVVGIAESHGRQDINSILKDFEILPRQLIRYRDNDLYEFDLDSALKRYPGLILIDEMAHTNAPGSRHAKRWQDIKELLDRGIDVYTTLNVQHIESLNDTVAQIVHAPIKETVPDSMLERADTIELIDIPPDELLKRLHEGKVYIPEQALLATENFFRKGNLIALRELALRVTAERVGTEVLLYRQDEGIKYIWPTKDKILVCVGPKPETLKLIRAAKRLANGLQAQWIAVCIDTPELQASEKNRDTVIQHLRLAEQLGAETRILAGNDIVKEIMDFAREQNVTQIMVWKYIHRRWHDWFHRNLADEMVRHSGEIDVYIMTGAASPTRSRNVLPLTKSIPWKIYGIAVGIITTITMVNFILFPLIASSNLIMLYLLGVTIVALFGRTGPSILVSILSVLAYDFFFIQPFYSFSVSDIQYFFTLTVMLLVSQLISHLTILIRNQAEAANLTQHQTSALYTLSRQLSSTRGIDKLLETGTRYLTDNFASDVTALLPKDSHLEIRGNAKLTPMLDVKEQGIAQWVFELGQIAGFGTETLSFSDSLYIPLIGSHHQIGVLRIHPKNKQLFTPEQMNLIEACANQIAMSLEVDRRQDQARQKELETTVDEVRSTLLQSISHDLRTPLITIMAATSALMELGDTLKGQDVKKIGKDIYNETEQLSRLLNNLLQITYLESENIKLQIKPLQLKDVINLVVQTSINKLQDRHVQIHIPGLLPTVSFDNTLIQEVLLNLIDNAVKFTPPKSPIEINVQVENDEMIVSIEDHGPGIMPDEVNKLFEKYYRGRMLTTTKGLGLGLAICLSIIKAHGGKIWAENRKDGGVAFRFTLPITKSDK